MSSIDDLSLISGISNISRISKINASNAYKLDSTLNISEYQSLVIDNHKLDFSKSSEASKVNDAVTVCEKSIYEYAKLKLIYDCLEDINSNHMLEKETLRKLKEIITISKIKKYMHLPSNSSNIKEELSLLGILDLPMVKFTYEEQLAVKASLEGKLREKLYNFIAIYENVGGSIKDVLKHNESILHSHFQRNNELENLHWKDKIDELCIEYKNDLISCYKMLKQWHNLCNQLNSKVVRDAEYMLLQAEIEMMKANVTKLSSILRMYKETPMTINAFKVLNKELDKMIVNIDKEIAEKCELKRAYNVLNGTEFEEILRKYQELCYVIEKKRKLFEKL